MKFDNEYQKQVWIYMLENVGTYNLYALLGKFDAEENIITHNVNQVVDIYIGGLKGSIQLESKRSFQAFELKGRNRNIVIQTTEKRSVIVIESIIMRSELREIILNKEGCKIRQAIIKQKGYGFNPEETLNLPNEIIFVAVQGCHNETTMKEHLIEITIMDYQGKILLFTVTAPRTFVTINPRHLGFDEEELLNGKDELDTLSEIRKILIGKTLVGYDIKKH